MAKPIPDFSDATLLLIGHGSTVNPESAASVHRQVARLREQGRFAQVEAALWKQPPFIQEVAPRLTGPRVFAAPFFVSDGYFTLSAVPRALGFETDGPGGLVRLQKRGDRIWHYCEPVGTHPRLPSLLLERAEEAVQRSPFPRAPRPEETALILAGHGTPRNARSRAAIESHAETIRGLGRYAEVHSVFIEEEPRVEACYRLASAHFVVFAPVFLSDGLHAAEDIPVLLGERAEAVQARLKRGQAPWRNPTERHGKLVWYAPGLGDDPRIAEIIIDRVAQMAGRCSREPSPRN